MRNICLAADGDSGFWPTGVVTLVLITIVCSLIGVWRSRGARKKDGSGQ
ncbi:hypothetical protein [Streptomyces fumanus]